MTSVELTDAEWQQVISAVAMTHPLVVKIAQQVQAKQFAERAQADGAADMVARN